MRETILKSAHEALGARLVPFGGWAMPVQYRPILEEAKIVRNAVGLFDLGHMGRVHVRGADAEPFLQALQTNDASKIQPGRIRYAMILDDDGKTQDDILVYREPTEDGFFIVVNASNTERDLEIMRRTASSFGDVTIEDQTDDLGMIALQGPASVHVMQELTDIDVTGLKYYSWARGEVSGAPNAAISRTGYTGEDGFEVYLPQAATVDLWNSMLAVGEKHGLAACGLGSRDILRLEAGMALYGHEIDETTTPLDANLGWAVKYTHDFTGRAALERIEAAGGPSRTLIGLQSDGKRVPRQGYPLWRDGVEIGKICSGGMSPTLSTNIATAYVSIDAAEVGAAVEFAIRDKREPAKLAELPFYKRNS